MQSRIVRKHDNEPIEQHIGYSQVVRTRDLVALAGVVSWSADLQPIGVGDIVKQITTVYQTIGRLLAAEGLTLADVIKETIYTLDMDGMIAAAEHRRRCYEAVSALPASTWVQVTRLAHPDLLLEVEVLAAARPTT